MNKNITKIAEIKGLDVVLLTKEVASGHIDDLLMLFRQIPQVTYTAEDVLAENKGDRVLYGKWEHSLAVIKNEKIIGVITGYERKAEDNDQYPHNTMYINELAIAPEIQKQGIGKKLLSLFLTYNKEQGFHYLSEPFSFSVQTNAAAWNNYVQNLYQDFGFVQRTTKQYDNRTDVVMGLD